MNRKPDDRGGNTIFLEKLNLSFDEIANQQQNSSHCERHDGIGFHRQHIANRFDRHTFSSIFIRFSG